MIDYFMVSFNSCLTMQWCKLQSTSLFPAIWLLPKSETYGGWPASGEIDIVESRGNDDLRNEQGVSMGNDHMGATLHWGPFWPVNGYPKTTAAK